MPEGPELYYLSQELKHKLKNQYFDNIVSNTKSTVILPKKSKIKDIYSYGKNLILETEDYILLVHLGITGWLQIEKPKIYKYILEFSKTTYYLNDRRRFSKLMLFENSTELEKYLEKFGVDILSPQFTLEYFENIIKSKKKLLCNLLLDQSYFAGLGNYIKNDALYLSKIHPDKKSNNMSENQIKDLYQNILIISYSNVFTHLENANLKIPSKLKKYKPNKLYVPYNFFVYEQEYDKKGNKVIYLKNHCGRRTFYVKSIQKE